MTPLEAYMFAASWGSYMQSGDPGAVMYGFQENCRPKSEEHRNRVIEYMKTNRQYVETHPEQYDDDELQKIDTFIEFIKNRGIEESFVIEIDNSGCSEIFGLNGEEITGKLLKDILDCNKSGDCEEACKHVLQTYKPQIYIVKKIDGEYKNSLADIKDKKKFCREVYSDSDSDFDDEDVLNLYIMWNAALSFQQELAETEA